MKNDGQSLSSNAAVQIAVFVIIIPSLFHRHFLKRRWRKISHNLCIKRLCVIVDPRYEGDPMERTVPMIQRVLCTRWKTWFIMRPSLGRLIKCCTLSVCLSVCLPVMCLQFTRNRKAVLVEIRSWTRVTGSIFEVKRSKVNVNREGKCKIVLRIFSSKVDWFTPE